MTRRLSNIAAIVIALSAAGAGIAALTVNRVDTGLTFGMADAGGRQVLVVQGVRPNGIGALAGARVGDIVLNIDGTMTRPDDRGTIAARVDASPRASVYVVAPDELDAAIARNDLAAPARLIYVAWATQRLGSSALSVVIGLALCLLALLWARSGAMGTAVRRSAVPLLGAAVVPLLVLPAYLTLSPQAIVIAGVLVAASSATAAAAITGGYGARAIGRVALIVSLAAAVGAGVTGLVLAFAVPERGVTSELRWLLASAAVIVPGLIAAASIREPNNAARLSGLAESVELAVAASFPVFTLAALAVLTNDPFVAPTLGWTILSAVLALAVLRPMAVEARRAAAERGLAIRGTEAERARIATAIHDDVLQDLSMVIHTLERAGAVEPAGAVRRSVDRLRAIGSDLRLPVLDDLGLRAAITSLASEHGQRAHTEIRFEPRGDGRYPQDVETGIFRIAQEAIVNAVKHGRPPITVHLACEPARVTLEVEDGGTGLSRELLPTAVAAGHIGLLTMTHRADEIGATLEIGAGADRRSRVTLMWTATAGPGAVASEQTPGV